MMKVKNVVIFTNGMVSSFDDKGEQIPQCQGFILDIAEELKNCCDEETKWQFGSYKNWIEDANLNWYWVKRRSKEDINVKRTI